MAALWHELGCPDSVSAVNRRRVIGRTRQGSGGKVWWIRGGCPKDLVTSTQSGCTCVPLTRGVENQRPDHT